MPASSSDKFKKGARKWVGQIGAGGVSDDTVATIPLSSTTGLPTDTAVVAVIDRVDSAGTKTPSLEETVVGVVSGNNLVTATRGAEGTAQAHLAGAVVEILITNLGYNDIIDGILVGHNQDGTHKSGSVLTLPQINDTSSDHQYIFSVCELVADRTVALPLLTGNDEFVFKDHVQTLTNKTHTSAVLNAMVSGTAVLDEDNMASNSATKLATQQSIKAYVDSSIVTDGWTASADTWTYASASTFTIAGVDRTAIYTKGTRLKFTQTSAKYAVVTGSTFSTDTTVTIAVNTDYTIANAAITAPYYSYMDSPALFPTHFAYTPTFEGFSAAPTGTFRWGTSGKLCWVSIYGDTVGTSNATTFTVSVPFAAVSTSVGVGSAHDSGSWVNSPARLVIGNAATKITVSKDSQGSAFTNSGNKTAIFQFVYGF